MFIQYLILIAGLLGPQLGHSQNAALCAPSLSASPFVFPRVQLVYGDFNPQEYTQGRSLRKSGTAYSYEGVTTGGLISTLDNLTIHDIWLDSGAGEMRPILEYFRSKKIDDAARVIAVVEKMSRSTTNLKTLRAQVDAQKFYPIVGQKIEDINSIPAESLTLITDIYGAGAYTRDLDAVLRRYLTWLKVGGHIYLTMNIRNYVYFLEEVEQRKYKIFGPMQKRQKWIRHRLSAFFDRIEGVSFEDRAYDDVYTVHIQKLSSRVVMPGLQTNSFRYDHPPLRGFVIP